MEASFKEVKNGKEASKDYVKEEMTKREAIYCYIVSSNTVTWPLREMQYQRIGGLM